MMNRRQQRGTTAVEFSIVAVALFMMVFGVLEVGRGYYVYSMLDEVTRRAARLATVCPVNDPAVPRLAIFNTAGDGSESALVNDLTPAHVVIDYLDANGNVVAAPSTDEGFIQIRFVRARVIGYEHQIAVPFIAGGISSVQMPQFEAVIPRESLGIPREGAVTTC